MTDAEVIADLREALQYLEQDATKVSNRGATTGPQWTFLSASLLKARATLRRTEREPSIDHRL